MKPLLPDNVLIIKILMKMTPPSQNISIGGSPERVSRYLRTILLLAVCLSSPGLMAQTALFLHHSTGLGVWNGGDGQSVPTLLAEYNSAQETTYAITERSYPSDVYPWENYPYDYWNLWLNGECSMSYPFNQCLGNMADEYDMIIFKHCFPGAAILEDQGDPDVSSAVKTLGNYKAQYRELRMLMDGYIGNRFLVWTLAPLHRLATTPEQAARAKAFVDWVNNDWLTEDGNAHPNIFIFDFFGYAAEQSLTPENGQTYCLRYEYEGSHTGSDSHPNALANAVIAPLFLQAVIQAFDPDANTGMLFPEAGADFYPNPTSGPIHFCFPEEVSYLSVYSISGQMVGEFTVNAKEGETDLSTAGSGLRFVVAHGLQKTYTGKVLIR